MLNVGANTIYEQGSENMTYMGISILLGVLLCVCLLGLIILCTLASREMEARLDAENKRTRLESTVEDLSARLTKYRIQAFWAKENAADAATSTTHKKNCTNHSINGNGGEVNG